MEGKKCLEQRLREIIPKPNSTFRELVKEEICSFACWDTDEENRVCLYYVVGNNNKKRVVISEVEELIRNCLTREQINRKDFEEYCHTSNTDGACGFAVMGRMLEYLGIAQYSGRGQGFEIIDRDLAERMIKMERDYGVSWHGAKKRKEIVIGKDVDTLFSKEQREIILHIDNHKYYSELPDSFFTRGGHLRTAYDAKTYKGTKGTNRLHEWVVNNNVERVKLEVITKYEEFRLSKYVPNRLCI